MIFEHPREKELENFMQGTMLLQHVWILYLHLESSVYTQDSSERQHKSQKMCLGFTKQSWAFIRASFQDLFSFLS